MRKRYAIVGTGGRSVMFIDAIAATFSSECELVALCDTSHTRLNWHLGRLAELLKHPAVPVYHADSFREMIAEARPDVVVVCSVGLITSTLSEH